MDMRKLIATATLALCAGAVSAQRTISDNVSLTANADWSADGTITINAGTTVDLAGHSLKVSGLAGEGSIVSTTDNLLPNASFENFTVTLSGNHGNFSDFPLVSWTYTGYSSSATAGWCKSRDDLWSQNLDAKDGTYSVFFWCSNASSGGAMVSNTVNIAVAGRYRLSFWTAARPGNNAYLNMRVHADVDGASCGYAVCSAAAWKETVILLDLSAGEHSIAFRSDGTGGGSNPCGLLDKVSLSRIAPLRLAHGVGATYSCQSLTLGPSVIPTAETQTLTSTIDWRGLGTVTVADGEKIDLAGNTLYTDGLVYDKAASDGFGVELIVNGNLESVDGTPSGGRGKLSESVHFTSWGWSQTDGSSHITWVANSGSGNWCANSPNGNYYVGWWIYANNAPSSISQTINVPADGKYRLSFLAAARPGNNSYLKLYVHADVDGASQGYVILDSTTWTEKTIDLSLTAGEHVIALRGIMGSNSGNNPCGGIDKISLVRVRNSATCVTNSTETLSELHMNIAPGTLCNDLLPIGGNLKLVKEGSGTYVSGMAQTYSGDTDVRGGTIQAPQSTAAYNASFTPFGTGTITVNSNAVFNAQSTAAYTNSVILNGGTIRGGAGDGTKRPIVMLERVTANSAIDQAVKAIDIGKTGVPIELGGHTLHVSIAARTFFRWYGALEGTTGKIVTTGEGYLGYIPEASYGLDLDASNNYLNFPNAVYLHDYRAANIDSNDDMGTGYGMYVSGTYTPVGDHYYGCTMQDGSTLDLSGRTGFFSVKSAISNSIETNIKNNSARQTARKTVQFAAGATVTVNLAGRTDLKTIAEGEDNHIVKWSTDSGQGEPSNVTFRLDGDTAQKFSLRSDATGLRLNKKKGFMLIVM